MEPIDMVKAQQDFIKRVQETSERLAKAWTAGIKPDSMIPGAAHGQTTSRRSEPGALLVPAVDHASVAALFQETLGAAARDLPELIRSQGNPAKIREMGERWKRAGEATVRRSLGLPSQSDAERVLEKWDAFVREFQSYFGAFSPVADAYGFRGFFSGVPGFSADDIFPFLSPKTYEKAMASVFAAYGIESSGGRNPPMQAAVAVHMKLLAYLLDFQRRLIDMTSKAIDAFVAACNKISHNEMGAEALTEVYRTWLVSSEKAFSELLKSATLASFNPKPESSCGETGPRIQALFSDWLSAFMPAAGRDMDALQHTVAVLGSRVEKLELQLGEVLTKLGSQPDG
jgi:hypothetical protein